MTTTVPTPHLSVNIDHVATLRQARYRAGGHAPAHFYDYGEPDVARAFHELELAGAHGVTMHLREDRRHVTDRDVDLVRAQTRIKFNLEMAATDEMIAIASRVKPHSAMLVPEGRNEVTTEGGLDVASELLRMKDVVHRLRAAGCLVSAFIDADLKQVHAAKDAGFDICEIHTGPYAHAFLEFGGDLHHRAVAARYEAVRRAGEEILTLRMRFNAGHALNYHNVAPIAALPNVCELHIGHSIISRAIYVGLQNAVVQMRQAMGSETKR